MAWKYLAAPTLKSKVQGTVKFGHDAAGKRGHGGGGVGPEQGTQRLAPALRFAEQIAQSSRAPRVVMPPRGFDQDLAAKRDALDCLARIGFVTAQTETRSWARRRTGRLPRIFDAESQAGHVAAFRRSSSKNRAISPHTTAPPERPRQCRRIRPDQLVALIDRNDEVFPRRADAIDEQRFDIGPHAAQLGIGGDEISSHASRRSSDSAAPAGPG